MRGGWEFEEIEPLGYDFLVFGIGAEVNFSDPPGRRRCVSDVHAAAAVRLKDHILERWEAADRDPGLVEDGALNM